MDQQVEISGAECVQALVLAGFRIARRVAGTTLLVRDGRFTIVPDALLLSPALVDNILGVAGLTHHAFLALLSDEPTLPDVSGSLALATHV